MNIEYLIPVQDDIVASMLLLNPASVASNIAVHSKQLGFPDLEGVKIALIGVLEGRKAINNEGCGENIDAIRKQFYKLFFGRWKAKVADLGNINQGKRVEDTYFAVSEVVSKLVKKNIIPIIIGGGQDITYANYKAYYNLEQTVNLVSVDSKFDLGDLKDEELHSQSYLSKIIMEKPNNLFNYACLGYQTYFNSQEEIKLLNSLSFDIYRLGEIKQLDLAEPVMRDADIVSIDLGSVRKSYALANKNATINGFSGDEICTIARYAGISDKVTSFGVYEYNSAYDKNEHTAQLVAQIIWYFIEGVNNRMNDYPFTSKEYYQKFTVLLRDDDPISFYKSNKSGRWWMEINLITDNKYKRHTLVPCTYQDYEQALQEKIPDRWYKAQGKLA